MERIINPNILVNLVSRRVRQLSTGGGGLSRPLIESEKPLGSADTALEEIIQEKIDFEDIKEENDESPRVLRLRCKTDLMSVISALNGRKHDLPAFLCMGHGQETTHS